MPSNVLDGSRRAAPSSKDPRNPPSVIETLRKNQSGRAMTSDSMAVWDRVASCHGQPLFQALWVRAWGDQYPADVVPYSSCTKALLDQLREEVQVPKHGTLVDLGCGAGGVGLWLARTLDVRLEGIDCSSRAIEIARHRVSEWGLAGRATFSVGDFSGSGLASVSIDAAVSIDALPFATDVDAALAETRRILRPGARLVFTAREALTSTPTHAEPGEHWRSALSRNGFELRRALNRPEVSSLWRQLYAEWIEHEQQLRAELSDEVAGMMIEEARENGPRLDEDRPWLLITAVASPDPDDRRDEGGFATPSRRDCLQIGDYATLGSSGTAS